MSYLTTLYKNHGKTIGFWEGSTDGPWVITRHAKALDAKVVEHRYEAKGKNTGKANETSAEEQAILEVQSKARLKLDKGYVEDIAAAQAPATNTLGLELPMLAQPIDKVKPESINWDFALVQPKLDGHRCLYKDGVLYSRQGKVLENLEHVHMAIRESGLADYHLDGELYIHGKSLQDLSSYIKKWRMETLELEYHIYDIISPEPYFERVKPLIPLHRGECDSVLQPVNTIVVTDMATVMGFHESYRAIGYEGTMLRHGTTGYRTGKRCASLIKIKEFHDAEFKVLAVEEGKPYIKGNDTYRVPVWVCVTKDNVDTFTVTAQGTMQEKHTQWEQQDQYIGKQLTVKYHYLSKDGIPQLPVALRWKEDL